MDIDLILTDLCSAPRITRSLDTTVTTATESTVYNKSARLHTSQSIGIPPPDVQRSKCIWLRCDLDL